MHFPSMWMDTLELGDRFMASTGSEVSRLDADGEVVHEYTGRHIYEAMFEDEDHLILSVALEDGDARQATLLRCDFHGSCERTTPIVSVSPQGGYTYALALPRW